MIVEFPGARTPPTPRPSRLRRVLARYGLGGLTTGQIVDLVLGTLIALAIISAMMALPDPFYQVGQ